jgi:hypothetical protein
MRCEEKIATGCSGRALSSWADRALARAGGEQAAGLPRVAPDAAKVVPRDVFLFFINGAKERAPAAATALLERLAARAG